MPPHASPPPPDLGAVFDQQFDYVWCTLHRLGIHDRDLEDVAQEVFLKVHPKLAEFDPSRPIRPWLFGFAFRVARDHQRLARNQREVLGLPLDPVDPARGADQQMEVDDERRLVETALQSVELERRAVLLMHDVDDVPIPEIARVLDINVNTAYARLRLAREELAAAVTRLRRRKVGPRERVRGKLLAVVPAMSARGDGVAGGGSAGRSTPSPAGGVLSGAARVPAALATAFLVGGAGGYALHAAMAKPAPPTVVYVDRIIPAPPAPPAVTASAFAVPAESEASASTKVAVARAAPSASATSQLQAERELLDEARSALVAGDPSRALDRVDQHRRRFLNPLLAEERDAMWVEALAQAGRIDEARQRAAAFRRAYPQSLFLPTIDSAVGKENP